LRYSKTNSIQLNGSYREFGGKYDRYDFINRTTPFNGTITYKNGKPIKTEINIE